MLLPILTVFVTVGTGAALALAPRSHGATIGHIRTFALTAAAGVVLVHFLPEALEGIGLWALLLTAGGLAIPHVLERGVSRVVARARSSARIGLEAGYAGLLAHKVGDGFALAAAEPQGLGAMVAIGAHTVPVVAFVVLAFGDAQGRRAGLLRALWLAAASVAGVLSYQAVSPEALEAMAPLFDSLVAGLLLHIVAHELGHDLPETARARAVDVAAATAGLAVIGAAAVFGAGHAHGEGHGGHDAPSELGAALLQVALASAPALLLALIGGSLLRAIAPNKPASLQASAGALSQAVHGLWRAVPSKLCSCRVLTATRELGATGAVFASAFVLGAPALALDGVILTAGMFGPSFTLVRVGTGSVIALAAALAAGWLARRRPRAAAHPPQQIRSEAPHAHSSLRPPPGIQERRRALATEAFHGSAWVLVGVLLAAQIVAFVPPIAAGPRAAPLQALALGIVALLIRPCMPAAVLVSAALATKGVAPGALLAALVVSPVLGAAGLSFFWRVGGAGTLLLIPLSLGVAVAAGLGLEASGWLSGALPLATAEPGALSWLALLALVLVTAQGPWRAGLRGWLAAAFELASPGADAEHGVACGCRSHARAPDHA